MFWLVLSGELLFWGVKGGLLVVGVVWWLVCCVWGWLGLGEWIMLYVLCYSFVMYLLGCGVDLCVL